MIKKTRLKNIFRSISGSLNRFLAISAIVALGAGFLGGLQATSPDMKDNADRYMDNYNLYDIDVLNELGFTEEQLKALGSIKEIKNIQKAIVYDEVFLDSNNKRLTMRVYGILDDSNELNMNQLELVQGNFPQNENECLVQITSVYSAKAPEVGSELTVIENGGKNFNYKTLKVSGVVKSPMYISAELEPSLKGSGFLDMAIYVKKNFYAFENYNHVFVTVNGAKELDTWSSEYKNLIADVKNKIDAQIKDSVFNQIDEITDYVKELPQVCLKAEAADLNLLGAEKSLAQKHNEVAEILIAQNEKSIFAEALKKEAELQQKNKREAVKYNVDKEELNSLLAKAQNYSSSIYNVYDRNKNAGYSGYKDNIEKISSLAKVFPVFFFFIALLVSLTTMTRLVEEKRTELGTLKSLGFASWQLLGQYLFYAFIFSLLGCAVGLVIGFKIFPAAVSFSYGMLYTIPIGKMPFRWNIAVPVSAIAIGVILVATAAACFAETLARPAVLISPKAPAPGKRILLEKIPFIWNKFNFSRKVTVRNMFRYKRRLWMTIIGIAGCSSLLVAGFGLRNSLQDIITIQYGQIDTYNLTILTANENSCSTDPLLSSFLNDSSFVTDYFRVSSESVVIRNGEKSLAVSYYVPENLEQVSSYVKLRTRKGHKPISLEGDGIVINEKQTELLGIKAGDSVEIENNDGIRKTVKVLGCAENYLYANMYSSAAEYEKLFGKKPVFNTVLCHLNAEKNNSETISHIMESPSVIYAMWIDNLLASAHKTIDSINIVVFVIIFTSGLLSFIVLYNLTNINICERKREIATLLVLGYTEKEAQRYIFREINVLSVIGTIVGLFFGGPLHKIVVHATEVNIVMWGRSVHASSYVLAFVISIVFTLIVNLLMKKSITSINMVESLKTKD